MTLEKYMQEIIKNKNGIYYGKKFPQKSFVKFLRQFEYVDTYEYWFDDDEDPDQNTWVDIEGIGYGWIWCNYRKSKKKQRKAIINFAKGLYEDSKNPMYYEFCNNIHYIWIENKTGASIDLIRCSHNELDWR